MRAEQWRVLSDWHNQWLESDPETRAELRAGFAAEHPDLLTEADAVVAASAGLPGFLETPAFFLAAHHLAADIPMLAADTMVGPYRIRRLLARGGMGDVYHATDVRLQRDVAIKVLTYPDAGSQRVARFLQEARLTASLDHPNVVRLFDVGLFEGRPYLVAELLEGETLRERIARGDLLEDEARHIAEEVAAGLVAAHRAQLVHRDLKPENIFLTQKGPTKILDFGIAKLSEDTADRQGLSTLTGVLLGTAGYLAPEQVTGDPVDGRADLFALGAILCEMLTGRRAFSREHTIDTLHAIVHDDPLGLRDADSAANPGLIAIVTRLLEKSPANRFQTAADVAWALRALSSSSQPERIGQSPNGSRQHSFAAKGERLDVNEPPTTPSGGRARSAGAGTSWNWRRALPWAAGAGALVILSAVVIPRMQWNTRAGAAPVRVSAALDQDESLAMSMGPTAGSATALSPDGRVLAFVARRSAGATGQLWIRRLDLLKATPLAGTDGAYDPFWSPDGQWVGFFANRRLQKVAVSGGAAVTLCDAGDPRGATWADDDTIIFTPNASSGGRLYRVPSAGGEPTPVFALAPNEATQRWPQWLPGANAILFTSYTTVSANYNDADIVIQPLHGGPRTVVQHGGYFGRYVSSGHVVYVHDGALFAVPFDLTRLESHGKAVRVLEHVLSNPETAGAQVAVSQDGTFVYLDEPFQSNAPLEWMDRHGTITPSGHAAVRWSSPQFSPDGRRVALEVADGRQVHVWLYESASEVLRQLTLGVAVEEKPVWTADGDRIVFATNRGHGPFNLYWERADGSGDIRRLTNSPNNQRPASWHPAGKFLAFTENNPQTNFDVMILTMASESGAGSTSGDARAFVNGAANEMEPMFSPDGHWVAYESDESGRKEVYVQPFPGPGGRIRVSTDGGCSPTWSRTRQELFYGSPDRRIMFVSYTAAGGAFRAGKPRPWSDVRYGEREQQRPFDLHPDGAHFLIAPDGLSPEKQGRVVFIFRFGDELLRVAPPAPR